MARTLIAAALLCVAATLAMAKTQAFDGNNGRYVYGLPRLARLIVEVAMKRFAIGLLIAVRLAIQPAVAEAPPAIAPGTSKSVTLQPVAVYDKDGRIAGSPDAPSTTMQMPFVRSGNGDPIIFGGITTTAKQFVITKPADATSYRFVNPCNVDVRIRKVASLSEVVTQTTGTRFLARSSETLGSSEPTFVSLIATAAPSGDCSPELQYGRGG